MNKVIQCELERYDYENGERLTFKMVTWLDADKNIRPGSIISLRDFYPDIFWHVKSVGQPHMRSDIKRGWGMTDYFGKVPKHVEDER